MTANRYEYPHVVPPYAYAAVPGYTPMAPQLASAPAAYDRAIDDANVGMQGWSDRDLPTHVVNQLERLDVEEERIAEARAELKAAVSSAHYGARIPTESIFSAAAITLVTCVLAIAVVISVFWLVDQAKYRENTQHLFAHVIELCSSLRTGDYNANWRPFYALCHPILMMKEKADNQTLFKSPL